MVAFHSFFIKYIMHDVDRDIMWLQRDLYIYTCNLFLYMTYIFKLGPIIPGFKVLMDGEKIPKYKLEVEATI